MSYLGFSLIELMLGIAITVTSCAIVIPSYSRFLDFCSGNLTLYQVRMAIQYAKSVSAAESTLTILCPNLDDRECGPSWDNGILVRSDAGTKVFKVFIRPHATLSLTQSGFNGQKLVIQADGLTHSNGQFNYKSHKSYALPQFNLYFNKTLRIYTS